MANQLPEIPKGPVAQTQVELPKTKTPLIPPRELTEEQKKGRPINTLSSTEQEVLKFLQEKPFSADGKQNDKFDFKFIRSTIDLVNSNGNINKILNLNSNISHEELVSTLLNIAADESYDQVAKDNKYDIRKLAFTAAMKEFTKLSENIGRLSNNEEIKYCLAATSIASNGKNTELTKLADEGLIKILNKDKTDKKAAEGSRKLSKLFGESLKPKENENNYIFETSKMIEIIGDIGVNDPNTEKKLVNFMKSKNSDPTIQAAAAYALIKTTKDEAIFDQARETMKNLRKTNDQKEVQRLVKKVEAYTLELIEEYNKKLLKKP